MNTNQIIISAVLLTMLAAAIYAFIKTPPAQRWAISRQAEKKEGVKYAPMYSKSERLKLSAIHICWLIPAFIFYQYYFLPNYREFMAHAECIDIASIKGTEIVFFGLFVGLPFSTAVIIFIVQGSRAIRALRAGQYPAPNEKVFHLTAYKYGLAAKLIAVAPFIIIFFLLGLSLWGGHQANVLINQANPCQPTNLNLGSNQ